MTIEPIRLIDEAITALRRSKEPIDQDIMQLEAIRDRMVRRLHNVLPTIVIIDQCMIPPYVRLKRGHNSTTGTGNTL